MQKYVCKDVNGTDGILNFWADFRHQVSLNRIFKVTQLRVDRYPPQKPHNLSTTMSSKVYDVTDEEKEAFAKITLADGSMVGLVEVFHSVYVYDCCPICTCKVDNSMIICETCKKPLHEREKTFKYELCLNLGDDKSFSIVGFRRSVVDLVTISNPYPSADGIEEILNNLLEAKTVKVEYTINKKSKERIVHTIEIVSNDVTE